jgi:hypothetical protein
VKILQNCLAFSEYMNFNVKNFFVIARQSKYVATVLDHAFHPVLVGLDGREVCRPLIIALFVTIIFGIEIFWQVPK